jgi:hypothetical protein
MDTNITRERQNQILRAHGYRWVKIDQDWLDANDDFETRPGWHLYAPGQREVSVARAMREIEIGIEAVAAEIDAEEAAEFEAESRAWEIARIRKGIEIYIINNGTRPADEQPAGETILSTQNVYGGGDWFVIGSDALWYIRNNGADGDNWSHNNIRTGGAGAIGWKAPMNTAIERSLRKLATGQPLSNYRFEADGALVI